MGDYTDLTMHPLRNGCKAYEELAGAARDLGLEVTLGRAVLLLCAAIAWEHVKPLDAEEGADHPPPVDRSADELCTEIAARLNILQYVPGGTRYRVLKYLRHTLAHASMVTFPDDNGQIEGLVLKNYAMSDQKREKEPTWVVELRAEDIGQLIAAFRRYAGRSPD